MAREPDDVGALLALLAAGLVTGALARFVVPGRYRALYEREGRAAGVDPDELHALALKETRERADLPASRNTNGTYDHGLMRITDVNVAASGYTAAELDRDPAAGVRTAARLLADVTRQAPHLSAADRFSVYNAGFSPQTRAGEPRRPKLNAAGVWWNADYVRDVYRWYALVKAARYGGVLVTTPGWRPA